MNIFRIQIGSPIIFYAGLILYANHILCKPLINSTSNDPCYRQVYLCMKIALNIHLTWCAELYIRAIVELEWVNVSENLHDKTGWLHSECMDLVIKNASYFFGRDSFCIHHFFPRVWVLAEFYWNSNFDIDNDILKNRKKKEQET